MTGNDNSHVIFSVADLISLQEAARHSGLSQGHLAHLIRKGDLWGMKIGRNWVSHHLCNCSLTK